MMSFTELAQANVDHYNNHPAEHIAFIAVALVGAVVVTNKFIKRIVKEDPSLRSGMYA